MYNDKLLSVQDVDNTIAEHMNKLDELWPEHDLHGPRKVHIVELIDAIKLRLHQRAQKAADKYESPFEKAHKKISGRPNVETRNKREEQEAPLQTKTAMQLAHEEARARMKGSPT